MQQSDFIDWCEVLFRFKNCWRQWWKEERIYWECLFRFSLEAKSRSRRQNKSWSKPKAGVEWDAFDSMYSVCWNLTNHSGQRFSTCSSGPPEGMVRFYANVACCNISNSDKKSLMNCGYWQPPVRAAQPFAKRVVSQQSWELLSKVYLRTPEIFREEREVCVCVCACVGRGDLTLGS